MTKVKGEQFTLSGKAFWAKVRKPVGNPNFPKQAPRWSMDLSIDEATAKEMKAKGIEIHTDAGERGTFVTLRKPSLDKEGKPTYPPKIVDAQLNEMDANTLIGNGSTVKVKVTTYPDLVNKGLTRLSFTAVQVIDLVPYEDKTLAGFDKQEGYTEPQKTFEDIDTDDGKCPF